VMSKSLRTVLTCKVDADLAYAVRRAAQREGASISAFLRRALEVVAGK
jgi:uncharacterized protein (DUF1778 family)